NWNTLDHFGKNGWLSLLACLKWWGKGLARMEIHKRGDGVSDWLMAIDNVSTMLDGLIAYKQN
ncbi:hypothetical protein GYMLUDRAFT_179722, partial [Collybiopsis luxurians FD-317 M1]